MARSGDLDVTKECSEYKGRAGDFCTITSSNLKEIQAGAKVIYAEAANEGTLDTDIELDAGSGNTANGHVVLDLAAAKRALAPAATRLCESARLRRFRPRRACGLRE